MTQAMDALVPVITIDGPAAVGKGTVAQGVAADLGFTHLDSGRFYRCVATLALAAGVGLDDSDGVLTACAPLLADPTALTRALTDSSLASEEVGQAASKVAQLSPVRAALTAPLRAQRRLPGLVADGRDMGTIVFTNATLKVFLDADLAVRAQRAGGRLVELQGTSNGRMPSSLDDFHARNARDSKRRIAPIEPASDATVINTDELDVSAVVMQVVRLFRRQEGVSDSF